jgi:hypothetical protein
MVILPPETVRFLKHAGFSLKSGSLARMRVVKPLAGGAWQVSIGGKLFAVRSTVPLQAGQVLTTRVTVTGNTVNLKVVSDQSGPKMILRSGDETAALNIVLQRSALPATEAVFAALRKAAGGGNFEERLQRMRLAAILLEKGIDPAEGLVDEILEPLSGRRGGSGFEGRGGGGDSQEEGTEAGGEGSMEESSEESREGEPTDEEEYQGDFLKLLRAQTRRDTDRPDHPLQLFNHISPSNWIVVPLAVEREGTVMRGSLRLLLERPGVWSRGALEVFSGGNLWRFALAKREGTTRVEILYPEGVTPEALGETLFDFLEKCEKVGVEIDDKVNRDTVFDGFTSEMPRKNIDTLV